MAEAKQRHWCLTAWLILMIVLSSMIVLSALVTLIPGSTPLPPPVARRVLTMALVDTCVGIANLVFFVALFRWKKWGLFGLVGISIFGVVTNLIRILGSLEQSHRSVIMHINRPPLGFGRVLLAVLWVVIPYALLQIGKEKRGWTQLE
jgi:hypothetical protein